jgi:hypothetical protein
MTDDLRRRVRPRSRSIVAAALIGAWALCCVGDIAAASSYLYFEPTEEAVATAARAAHDGLWWSAALVVLGVGVVVARRHVASIVLSGPGVLGAVVFAERPAGHGLPLVVVVLSSLCAVAVLLATHTLRSMNSRSKRRY